MNDAASSASASDRHRRASTKGKLRGPKPPLRVGHVWSIRAKLQLERRVRDLALFNLAINSKLRGCDLVALRVDDVAPNSYAIDSANVRQSKTGRSVRFELTEVTRQALNDYLRMSGRQLGQCLFPGRRGPGQHLSTRQYARLVVDQRHRPRPTQVCDALHAPNQGDVDIPSHRQSASGSTALGPHQN